MAVIVGLHFKPLAYKILYDELMNLIRDTWPEEDAAPEKLDFVFKTWEEFKVS